MSRLKTVRNYILVTLLPVAMFLVVYAIYPQTAKLSQLLTIFQQAILPAILAWGLYFNITAGNWDFSLGANALISGIVSCNIADRLGLGLIPFILICIAIATAIGAVNAILFYVTKIPTLIISIGLLFVLESLSGIVFNGSGAIAKSEWVIFGMMPYNIVVGVVFFLLALYLYKFNVLGYHVRAVGENSAVAQSHGIDVYMVKVKALIVAGFFSGVYAFTTLGSVGILSATSGMTTTSQVFDGMMCYFIGLVLVKYANCIFTIYIGSVFLQMIKFAILVIGFNTSYQRVFISLMVIALIAVNNRQLIADELLQRKRRKASLLAD